MQYFLFALAALAAVFGYTVLTSDGRDGPSTVLAAVKCQSSIRGILRDPSSAEWVDRSAWPVEIGETYWTVTATVRAANGFGGKSVDTFQCFMVPWEDTFSVFEVSPL